MNGWYLAKIVEDNSIEEESDRIVFVNYVLIEANNSREAHEETIELGKENELSYLNSDQKTVTSIFRGLAGLSYISDTLVDGIIIGILPKKTSDITQLVTEREDLTIFETVTDIDYANARTKFVAKDILDKVSVFSSEIPADSNNSKIQLSWFLAEAVLEENSTPIVVQIIFKSTSSQDSYSKAIELAILQAQTSGKIYHGLHDIYQIGAELTHGSEILFEEYINIDEDEIKSMLVEKQDLEVFQQS